MTQAVSISLSITVGYFSKKKGTSFGVVSIVFYTLVGLGLGFVLSVAAVTATVRKMSGPFNPYIFITSNTYLNDNGGGGGELKLIDPLSLEVVAEVKVSGRGLLSQRSYARPLTILSVYTSISEHIY